MMNDRAFVRNNTTNGTVPDSLITKIVDYYLIPGFVIIGLVTNSLSFIVFTKTNLTKQSSSVYLAALALSDNHYLVNLWFFKLTEFGIPIYHKSGWCQYITFTNQVSMFVSSWLIVSFTLERWIAVSYPFKKCKWCTKARGIKVILAIFITSLFIYSYALVVVAVIPVDRHNEFLYLCMPKPQFITFFTNASIADIIISHLIPSFIIICFNISIGVKVRKATRLDRLQNPRNHDFPQRSTITLQMEGLESNQHNSQLLTSKSNPKKRYEQHTIQSNGNNGKRVKNTTRMLLLVSSFYVFLNTPGYLLKVFDLKRSKYSTLLMSIRDWFQTGYHFNFIINFFLYSLSTKNFRIALSKMFKDAWKKIKPK